MIAGSYGVQHRTSSQRSTIEMGTSFLSRRIKILIASIAFAIGIAAAWFIRDSLLYERTDDARIDGEIIPLSARISGHVQQVNVIEGEAVHAGDVLAVLDPKEYSLAVYQAIANLAMPRTLPQACTSMQLSRLPRRMAGSITPKPL